MGRPRVRWWVALVTWLIGMLACACSKTAARPQAASSKPQAASARPKAASRRQPAAGSQQPAATAATPKQAKTPATGKGRQHPFARVLDSQARRARLATRLGPLTLKAVLGGPARMAIIQEGTTTHVVREGEYIGGLAVLSIRDGEVVLSSGPRKQILSLYATELE